MQILAAVVFFFVLMPMFLLLFKRDLLGCHGKEIPEPASQTLEEETENDAP